MNRNIFQYQLDGKPRFADPLATWNTLTVLLRGDPFAVCDRAASEEGKSEAEIAQATQEICDAVMQAFKLPAFDPETGTGATMQDALRIWGELNAFNADCKKKSDSSPTCARRTA